MTIYVREGASSILTSAGHEGALITEDMTSNISRHSIPHGYTEISSSIQGTDLRTLERETSCIDSLNECLGIVYPTGKISLIHVGEFIQGSSTGTAEKRR